MRIQIHPHLISSPNRGKNSAGGFISFRFLCGKLHHLFIFWPLNAAANAKSFSIFERNYKFPFYLMSCKPWFGKISVENESRIIWFRARGLKEEIGLWQLWNMLEIFQFRWIGVACEELGPNRWEKGVWQFKSSQTQPPHISLNLRERFKGVRRYLWHQRMRDVSRESWKAKMWRAAT